MVGDGYALVLHGDADASKLGGTAICGFSSTGMVGVIAASHIIRALDFRADLIVVRAPLAAASVA